MAKIEEYCEVKAGGSIYRDWLTATVEYSLAGEPWMRRFRLQVAEIEARSLKLKPDDKVDVTLAGQPVILQGMISDRQAAFDANRHAVQVDGVSHAALAEVASIDVPRGQFRDYSLEPIANAVLKPLGIKFRIDGSPEGADLKFRNVAVRFGESPIDMIRRLCRQRSLRFSADADGTIVAGRDVPGAGDVLEEGNNILSATSHISLPWVGSVVANAQQPGSDQINGRRASEISAKASMLNGVSGATRKVLAEMPLAQNELQLRANWEVATLQEALVRVTVVHKGWMRPTGGLWELRKPVKVRSKMLFPTAAGEMDLYVFGVLCAQDAQAGSTTSLDLRNRAAMGSGHADATQSDGFYEQPATRAQPEASA